MTNKLEWFNNKKGFGFIEYKDNNNILIHYESLVRDKCAELELVKTNNGYEIKNIMSDKNEMFF